MTSHPIARFRALHELTLDAFGELVGVKKSVVSKWENGIAPSPQSAIEVERATGIPRHELRPDLWTPPSTKGAAA